MTERAHDQDEATARRRGLLALALVALLALAFVSLTRARATVASVEVESQPAQEDYSRFSHASARHASLACASCHARAADNSNVPRLPGHKACTDCHLAQFVTQNAPMCSICHSTVEGRNPPVKNFPALASFNARFDHAQHSVGAARPARGFAACHEPVARRVAALSIPTGFGAHAACYACHRPEARAAGRDIATCGVCHAPSQGYARTLATARAFSVGFSHAAHGARQRLSCADCHQTRANQAQSRQVTSTRAAEHFPLPGAQSCATCHDNRRAFGEARYGDCRRCHRGPTFRDD